MFDKHIHIFPDTQHVALAAANRWTKLAEEAVRQRGVFSVVLSGGNTPRALYHLMTTEPYSEAVDWAHTQIFWGDERCVPPDHPDSNYLHAKTALLEHVPVPPENIHRILAEQPPTLAAAAYEETLLSYFSGLPDHAQRQQAQFDLVLLGLGEDAHTASLFPGTPIIQESARWVAPNYVEKLAAWRISLTPVLLNRAAHILFLVEGAGKRDALQSVLYGTYQPERYPAQIIQPQNGTLEWYVDEAAAALL